MSDNCPKCWAHLQTPLFCESCEEILEANNVSPYRILGVAEYEELVHRDNLALA